MSQLGVVYLDERGEEATCRNWVLSTLMSVERKLHVATGSRQG